MVKLHHIDKKQLSEDFTIVWWSYDREDECMPGDPGMAHCGIYYQNYLVSTVYWPVEIVTLEIIKHFLETTEQFQRMPGWTLCPETI